MYGMLENGIGPEARSEAKSLRLRNDKMGGVVDLPDSMTETVESCWRDSNRVQLKKCEALPDLEPERWGGGGGGGGRFGGGGGFRSGGRGGRGGGGG